MAMPPLGVGGGAAAVVRGVRTEALLEALRRHLEGDLAYVERLSAFRLIVNVGGPADRIRVSVEDHSDPGGPLLPVAGPTTVASTAAAGAPPPPRWR